MRTFLRANAPLLAVAAAVAVPLVRIGLVEHIGYDGWIHIFVSRSELLQTFFVDWHKTTQPPLYFLLLKASSFLGTSLLAYRVLSILAGLFSVFMVGKITERITSSRALAVLAAAAFGLSLPTVILSVDVRSYTMAVAFILIAFYGYLRMAGFEDGVRDHLLFSAGVIAGILTLYATALFFIAAALTPFVIAVLRPDYGRRLIGHVRTGKWILPVAAFAAPAMVLAVAWRYHMWQWAHPLDYMPHLYFDRTRDSLAGFLRNGILQELNLFSPVAITLERVALSLFIALIVAAVVALIVILRARAVVAAVPLVVLLILTAQIIGLSVLAKYPFGGHLRHQYLLFPFFMLSLFSIAGVAIRSTERRVVRHAIIAVLAVLTAAGAIAGYRQFHIAHASLYLSEMQKFRAVVPLPTPLYLDEFSTIAFFSRHHAWDWQLEGLDGRDTIHYRVTKDGESLHIVRVRNQWNLKPFDEALYRDLRQTMDRHGIRRVGLFALLTIPAGMSAEEARSRIAKAAATRQLAVDNILIDGENLYARLVAMP